MPFDWFNRLAVVVAGVLGASGVAAAAAAAHEGGALLAPLSLIALSHAPAMLAVGLSTVTAMAFASGRLSSAPARFSFAPTSQPGTCGAPRCSPTPRRSAAAR